MGAVYEAQTPDGSRHAVKVIVPELAGKNPGARRRFVREARAVSSIDSDHVVRVVEADTDPEQQLPYIVMELLCGMDLDTLIERHGALQPHVVARLFVQASRGLEAAHELSFVHRDIKPANLFLHEVPSGEVVTRVCDFGVAKQLATDGTNTTTANLTHTGGVIGSPMYMSPEQTRNAKHIDSRTDVWSLGISLYQALTGRQPWEGRDTVGELILAICTEPLPHVQDKAPWVSKGLVDVVHKALRRDRAERFQSMTEFAQALLPFTDGSTVVTPDLLTPVPKQIRVQSATRAAAPELTSVSAGTVAHTAAEPKKRTPRSTIVLAVVAAAAVATTIVTVQMKSNDPVTATSEPHKAAAPKDTVPAVKTAETSATSDTKAVSIIEDGSPEPTAIKLMQKDGGPVKASPPPKVAEKPGSAAKTAHRPQTRTASTPPKPKASAPPVKPPAATQTPTKPPGPPTDDQWPD